MGRILLLVWLFIESYGNAQTSNLVFDSTLDSKLREYLISRVSNVTRDENGNIVSNKEVYAFEEILITSRNLKSDSAIQNKNMIGVYGFKFASVSAKPYLYIQHPDRIEFIEIENNVKLKKILSKIMNFLEKNDKEFSFEEKLNTIKNAMEILYFNRHPQDD